MIEHLSSNRFAEQAAGALADETQRRALSRALETIAERRGRAVALVPEWEELRERARSVKADVLANLDVYLERFASNAERAGVELHWARDHEEACAIVEGLAERLRAGTIAKAKSMVTEEIGLNRMLERRGLRPVETDLGEWIVQLAGETPSHIIVPAIHKTRGQIADLFAEKLAIERTESPAEMTAVARRILRETFAQAQLGISGVNFAVAETGSILLLENEGNIRMTTSLPRAHVAVMGIEKLVPRLADLELFLRLLPRSGTGQRLTSYQSILTGPKRSAGDEGPEELHVVILDNGRSGLLREAETRETLACIRCGACLNACPVYRQIGGHAYGSTYAGPIGAVLTPQLAGVEKARELPYASSLCGACRDVCPVKIDLPRLLLRLRSQVAEGDPARGLGPQGGRWMERQAFRAWAWVARSPRRFERAGRIARRLQPLWSGSGALARFVRRAVPPLRAWSSGRELRPFASKTFRELWKERER